MPRGVCSCKHSNIHSAPRCGPVLQPLGYSILNSPTPTLVSSGLHWDSTTNTPAPASTLFPSALLLPCPNSAPLVFIVSITSGAFALSLAGFLAMHGQLIAANCTTIEMYEKDRLHPWPYNKGFRRNFEEVFGRK